MIRRWLVVAMLVATLTACATSATMSGMDELPADNGLVLTRPSSNAFKLGFFKYRKVLTVEEADVGETRERT